LAFGHGGFRLLPALAALVGAVLIQIGTNLANDYYDFVRGGDTEERVGPTRVTQAGIFEPKTVRNAAFLALVLSAAVGVYLVEVGGAPILFIGLASLVCAVAYTGGPFPLAYHGLGDLFVFLFFGLAAVGGTYWVQALAFGPEVLLAGAGMGALATAILVVNNLRDIETDAQAGKRTLAVRLGAGWTKVEYLVLIGSAVAVPFLGILWFGWRVWVLVPLAALYLLVEPARVVSRFFPGDDPAVLVPPLGKTAQAAGLFGLLFGAALALG
jgi:1,4-dihydroxy-2-naphthoate octaprenyltransferase